MLFFVVELSTPKPKDHKAKKENDAETDGDESAAATTSTTAEQASTAVAHECPTNEAKGSEAL
jgi:hypothetical protein